VLESFQFIVVLILSFTFLFLKEG